VKNIQLYLKVMVHKIDFGIWW